MLWIPSDGPLFTFIFFTAVRSAHMHEIGTSCFTVLDLEYFIGFRQSPFFFYLSFEDDRHGSGLTYCTNTNMCYFLWESINSILSVLFAIEAFYTKKENNNKEKSFYRRKLTFCWRKLPLRKAYLASAFFCRRKLPFWRRKLRKAFFATAFSCQRKKNLNSMGWKSYKEAIIAFFELLQSDEKDI